MLVCLVRRLEVLGFFAGFGVPHEHLKALRNIGAVQSVFVPVNSEPKALVTNVHQPFIHFDKGFRHGVVILEQHKEVDLGEAFFVWLDRFGVWIAQPVGRRGRNACHVCNRERA